MKKNVVFVSLGLLSILLLVVAFVIPEAFANSKEIQVKTSIIDTKGSEIGTAEITQKADRVQLHIEAKGLTPGTHGIHFHEMGKCEPPDFKTAGAHLNPNLKQHGFNNPKGFHAGDLLNIEVKADGTVSADLESKTVTLKKGEANSLLKSGGSAIVIHEKADDYVTDPSGNSGDRIACGVIKE
ncbi:superoxide dismutase family protein [Paenibacillus macquariensis]|uniref:Superoxide dismutase [Cu-Zn] n=1 Tax=Paenibacillus macquariensis TaxID=948756 RepID=A0ABY1JP23_9BACL|nr:superoxide dismutase family protein [Paenibacillus macquariensis]MEC0092077.1 superoxide dismutase family protein [Paenibacillus macquariensis]OAB37357.1 superoxide dismutase [Paenibacillus macquariensis subsp. macquariensis]SIQ51561.1 superoxide dismutase, Cu-Zn family [Paenibacillus macquariensis]